MNKIRTLILLILPIVGFGNQYQEYISNHWSIKGDIRYRYEYWQGDKLNQADSLNNKDRLRKRTRIFNKITFDKTNIFLNTKTAQKDNLDNSFANYQLIGDTSIHEAYIKHRFGNMEALVGKIIVPSNFKDDTVATGIFYTIPILKQKIMFGYMNNIQSSTGFGSINDNTSLLPVFSKGKILPKTYYKLDSFYGTDKKVGSLKYQYALNINIKPNVRLNIDLGYGQTKINYINKDIRISGLGIKYKFPMIDTEIGYTSSGKHGGLTTNSNFASVRVLGKGVYYNHIAYKKEAQMLYLGISTRNLDGYKLGAKYQGGSYMDIDKNKRINASSMVFSFAKSLFKTSSLGIYYNIEQDNDVAFDITKMQFSYTF